MCLQEQLLLWLWFMTHTHSLCHVTLGTASDWLTHCKYCPQIWDHDASNLTLF